MAEEHNHHAHGLAHGHHSGHEGGGKDNNAALYWSLGIGAAGLMISLILLSGGSKKQPSGAQSPGQLVHESRDFIPNPTDISIGTNAAPLYWPALPTSGTPSKPKTHHHGDSKDKDEHNKKHKKKEHGHSNKSNDKKGYGKSPAGHSGHHVSATKTIHPSSSHHAPVSHHNPQKGKANG